MSSDSHPQFPLHLFPAGRSQVGCFGSGQRRIQPPHEPHRFRNRPPLLKTGSADHDPIHREWPCFHWCIFHKNGRSNRLPGAILQVAYKSFYKSDDFYMNRKVVLPKLSPSPLVKRALKSSHTPGDTQVKSSAVASSSPGRPRSRVQVPP